WPARRYFPDRLAPGGLTEQLPSVIAEAQEQDGSAGTLKDLERLSGCCLPQPDRAVLPARCHPPTVGAVSDLVDWPGGSPQGPANPRHIRVPRHDRRPPDGCVAAGGQTETVRTEGDRPDNVLGDFKRQQQLPIPNIPQPHRSVVAAHREPPSVGGER